MMANVIVISAKPATLPRMRNTEDCDGCREDREHQHAGDHRAAGHAARHQRGTRRWRRAQPLPQPESPGQQQGNTKVNAEEETG